MVRSAVKLLWLVLGRVRVSANPTFIPGSRDHFLGMVGYVGIVIILIKLVIGMYLVPEFWSFAAVAIG